VSDSLCVVYMEVVVRGSPPRRVRVCRCRVNGGKTCHSVRTWTFPRISEADLCKNCQPLLSPGTSISGNCPPTSPSVPVPSPIFFFTLYSSPRDTERPTCLGTADPWTLRPRDPRGQDFSSTHIAPVEAASLLGQIGSMGRRNILLCIDAFGTLFQPKRPVAEQYAAVASQCGLGGFSAEQVQASFKTAFSEASEEHPNYGRASGMGAEKWWANVSIRPDTIPSPALTEVVFPMPGDPQDIPTARRPWERTAQRSCTQTPAPLQFEGGLQSLCHRGLAASHPETATAAAARPEPPSPGYCGSHHQFGRQSAQHPLLHWSPRQPLAVRVLGRPRPGGNAVV